MAFASPPDRPGPGMTPAKIVVAVNLFGGVLTHPLEQVREALGLVESVPLLTVDARSRRSALQALVASLKNTLEKTSPLLAR
jgi:uncharacterized protein